jgi:hypothetical protein
MMKNHLRPSRAGHPFSRAECRGNNSRVQGPRSKVKNSNLPLLDFGLWIYYALEESQDKPHNTDMSEETAQNINGGRSFEERVFARFDALDSAIHNLDSRLQIVEARAYDTKPIWEQALKEIVGTRHELVETRRELSKRLDRIEAIAHETRADLARC